MTPRELLEWQDRLGMSGAESARSFGIPYLTYRSYLPGGTRRQDRLPGWVEKLCRYVEKYGPTEGARDGEN